MRIMFLLFFTLILVSGSVPGLVSAQSIGDGSGCIVESDGGVISIVPNGEGQSLESVGASIRVTARSPEGAALAGIPAADIWLEDSDGLALVSCGLGITADGPTDAEGVTWLRGTVAGGGYTGRRPGEDPTTEDGGGGGSLVVVIQGVRLTELGGGGFRDIQFKSPDYDGDLRVDIRDVGVFAYDFNARSRWRSDFDHDGTIDLVDVGFFAEALGRNCE